MLLTIASTNNSCAIKQHSKNKNMLKIATVEEHQRSGYWPTNIQHYFSKSTYLYSLLVSTAKIIRFGLSKCFEEKMTFKSS